MLMALIILIVLAIIVIIVLSALGKIPGQNQDVFAWYLLILILQDSCLYFIEIINKWVTVQDYAKAIAFSISILS
jgi:hypothetical protein